MSESFNQPSERKTCTPRAKARWYRTERTDAAEARAMQMTDVESAGTTRTPSHQFPKTPDYGIVLLPHTPHGCWAGRCGDGHGRAMGTTAIRPEMGMAVRCAAQEEKKHLDRNTKLAGDHGEDTRDTELRRVRARRKKGYESVHRVAECSSGRWCHKNNLPKPTYTPTARSDHRSRPARRTRSVLDRTPTQGYLNVSV